MLLLSIDTPKGTRTATRQRKWQRKEKIMWGGARHGQIVNMLVVGGT